MSTEDAEAKPEPQKGLGGGAWSVEMRIKVATM